MLSKYKEKLKISSRINFSQKEDYSFHLVYICIFLIFVFLIIGLFQMQFLQGRQNLLAATRTSQNISLVLPQRGVIYDANGNILAYNAPTYSVYADKTQIDVENEREIFSKLADLIDSDVEVLLDVYRTELYSIVKEESLIRVKSGINSDTYFRLIENSDELIGFTIQNDTQRRYSDPEYFSHILGYIGKPAENELSDEIFTVSKVGKLGVEKVYDDYLRGKVGKKIEQKQYLEDIESTFISENKIDGDNLHLTIDSRWQKKLSDIMEESLVQVEGFASAGVIMDSNSGEIKAMVGIPGYDNNLFSDGIKNEQYQKFLEDDKTPLLNRPIALQLPSGSIFKVIGASAGLETGVINRNTIIMSEGCLELSAGIVFCEADKKVLGNLNVVQALSQSSNLFFCKVAMSLNRDADGIYTTLKYAEDYGLGSKTGIDLYGEQVGSLPSPELKKKLFNENWYLGDDCNSMIGQGLLTVTPIQMVVVASAINNGGEVLKPHVLDKVVSQENEIVLESQKEVIRKVSVSETNLDIIKEGMKSAAKEGSGSILRDLNADIIIKTGSADASEVINGKVYSGAHSWIMGCFNHQGSDNCFVVIQQWAGRGYQTVPIIKKFVNCVQTDFSPNCEKI
ncbi:MAG TPA: penicillin-binding transpeptidase domain-containing protein [Candidatus Dojkabacteria bacterium]|nr:penicillin-binding transpeptidase domain-containing protein [Candidatus Dojkabacteria bacterium]